MLHSPPCFAYSVHYHLLKRGRKKFAEEGPRAVTNEAIAAMELRVIGPDGENIGVLPKAEALKKARELEFDLIEISAKAKPPVARIGDVGKYLYEEKKRIKERKAKAHITETKSVQVKIGTSEHDLALKARRASQWLSEGHRVKVELYLRGRAKYLDKAFLHERLERFLKLISTEYSIAEKRSKNPKGLSMVVEKA